MLTLDLYQMTAEQLARLYLALTDNGQADAAQAVFIAGVANCGLGDFDSECSNVKREQRERMA